MMKITQKKLCFILKVIFCKKIVWPVWVRSSTLSMMSLALGYSEPLAETDFYLSSCHGEWATLHKVNYTFTNMAKLFISNLMATVLNHISSIKAEREWRFDGTFGISESMCNGSNLIFGYFLYFIYSQVSF